MKKKKRYYAALILENEHFRERVEAINGTTLSFLLGDYITLSDVDYKRVFGIFEKA